MKKEPCIRLGIRISPKMREKPDESRNSKPPSATLFTAKVSHRRMCQYSLLLEVLGRRIITRVNRVRQECLFLVGPELAHIRIGFNYRIDELAILLLTPADEDVADDIAIWIELDGAARLSASDTLCRASASAVRSSALDPRACMAASTHWPATYMPAE